MYGVAAQTDHRERPRRGRSRCQEPRRHASRDDRSSGGPRNRTWRCGFGDHRVTDTPVPRGGRIVRPRAALTRRAPLEALKHARAHAESTCSRPVLDAMRTIFRPDQETRGHAQRSCPRAPSRSEAPGRSPARQPPHSPLGAEQGDTLIEALISAVLLAVIIVATLTGLDTTNRSTALQRARSQADRKSV